jgi:2-C-methyl-D-erythritol 4-phosphate cytidylyltransferase
MTQDISFSVIFLCGGQGSRTLLSVPKQYHKLGGKELFHYSLEFLQSIQPTQLCIVCEKSYEELFTKVAPLCLFAKPGSRRQDSTENGLNALTQPVEYILVHDSARPFITRQAVDKLLSYLGKQEAATLASKATSTIRISDKESFGKMVPQRELTWDIQTPQLIKQDILTKGLKLAKEQHILLTDDVAAAELLGYKVKLVENEKSNIKITYPEDLLYAEFLLSKQK